MTIRRNYVSVVTSYDEEAHAATVFIMILGGARIVSRPCPAVCDGIVNLPVGNVPLSHSLFGVRGDVVSTRSYVRHWRSLVSALGEVKRIPDRIPDRLRACHSSDSEFHESWRTNDLKIVLHGQGLIGQENIEDRSTVGA